MGDFQAVLQQVLPEAGPVFQHPNVVRQIAVIAIGPDLAECFFTHLDHVLVEGPAAPRYDLLDARRSKTTVGNQLLHSPAGDFAAGGVIGGQQHRIRSIIDHDLDPGRRLKGPHIAPFFADNAALDPFVGQGHGRGRDLDGFLHGTALNGLGNDLFGLAF